MIFKTDEQQGFISSLGWPDPLKTWIFVQQFQFSCLPKDTQSHSIFDASPNPATLSEVNGPSLNFLVLIPLPQHQHPHSLNQHSEPFQPSLHLLHSSQTSFSGVSISVFPSRSPFSPFPASPLSRYSICVDYRAIMKATMESKRSLVVGLADSW